MIANNQTSDSFLANFNFDQKIISGTILALLLFMIITWFIYNKQKANRKKKVDREDNSTLYLREPLAKSC